MRLLSSSLLLILCFSLNAQIDIPQDSLVAYFIGMDANGQLLDIVGQNDGIPANQPQPTTDRFGGEGCAVLFDGGESYFFSQNLDDVNADGPYSISLWYQGGSDEDGDYESMVVKPMAGSINVQSGNYTIGLHDLNKVVMGSDQNYLWMNDGDAPIFPANDEWHHLVVVYGVDTWTMYLDNVAIEQMTTGNLSLTTFASDLWIGFSFDGALDDIALYKRALTSEDVTVLFVAPGQCGVVSVDELDDHLTMSLYPNPTSGTLIVNLPVKRFDEYMVTDLSGRIVLREATFTNSFHTIDLSSVSRGTYIFVALNKGVALAQQRILRE